MKTSNIFKWTLGIFLFVIVAVILAGMYKFNYLSGKPGYDVDGNRISEEEQGQIMVCDESGNRYRNASEARAAGLADAEFGATYCAEKQ